MVAVFGEELSNEVERELGEVVGRLAKVILKDPLFHQLVGKPKDLHHLLETDLILVEDTRKLRRRVELQKSDDFRRLSLTLELLEGLLELFQLLLDSLGGDQVGHLVVNLLGEVVDVQLEESIFGKLSVLGHSVRNIDVGEDLDFLVEPLNQFFLRFHLINAHELADRDLEGTQAADVGDVDVEQTFESRSLRDVSLFHDVVVQNFGQSQSQLLKGAL